VAADEDKTDNDQGGHPEPGEDFHEEAVDGYSTPKAEYLGPEIHKRFLLPPVSLPSAVLAVFAAGTQKCANIKIEMIRPSMMMGRFALGFRTVNWAESRFRRTERPALKFFLCLE
jgi:hypothetical protein